MIVALTYADFLLAGQVATVRATSNLFKRRQHRHGESGGYFPRHFEGALAEYAAAKALNLHWPPPLDDFGAVDVGGLVDVRSTTRADGRLILHKDDEAGRPFILARLHELPNVALVGWITARNGQVPQFWTDTGNGRPAYFVPDDALYAMSELVELISARRAA